MQYFFCTHNKTPCELYEIGTYPQWLQYFPWILKTNTSKRMVAEYKITKSTIQPPLPTRPTRGLVRLTKPKRPLALVRSIPDSKEAGCGYLTKYIQHKWVPLAPLQIRKKAIQKRKYSPFGALALWLKTGPWQVKLNLKPFLTQRGTRHLIRKGGFRS